MAGQYRFLRFFIAALVSTLLLLNACSDTRKQTMAVYCGAGMSKAAAEIGVLFEKKYDIAIHYSFAGSNTLLSQIQIVKKGDVYVPASDYYMEIASNKKLVEKPITIAFHIPVIAVPKGNPKNITSLEDLAGNNIRIGLGDPKAAAIGKTSVEILRKNNLEKQVNKNVVTRTATVNELVVYLGLNQVDAAVIWEDNAVAAAAKVDLVPIPRDQNRVETIPAAVLTLSKQKKHARRFIDFLRSPKAKEILEKYGFKPYEKDVAGCGLRVARCAFKTSKSISSTTHESFSPQPATRNSQLFTMRRTY